MGHQPNQWTAWRQTKRPFFVDWRLSVLLPMTSILLCAAVMYQPWFAASTDATSGAQGPSVRYGTPKRLCHVDNPDVRESSGLAISRRQPDVLWTHNDSGDGARIFAFNLKGEDLGTFQVFGARANDWEDIASFRLEGKSYLVLADVGNNRHTRSHGTLYLVEEPEIGGSRVARLAWTVHFQYADGRHNCEAVAFDPVRREFLLVTKSIGLASDVYQLPWSHRHESSTRRRRARRIGSIGVPMATAMDISPDGRRAIVLSYGNAHQFERRPGENWQQAFARGGHRVVMPARRQGESICYGRDGQTLYLTSEQSPTPLFEVPIAHHDQSSTNNRTQLAIRSRTEIPD